MAELPDGLSESEKAGFEQQLREKQQQLERFSGGDMMERARLQLDIAEILVFLERKEETWNLAREAFDTRYVIDIRADDAAHENLARLANNLIARVAARHSNVQDQQALNGLDGQAGIARSAGVPAPAGAGREHHCRQLMVV